MPRSVSEDTRCGALTVKCCSCRRRYLGHDIIVQTQDGHFKILLPRLCRPRKAQVRTRKILSLAVINRVIVALKQLLAPLLGKRQTSSTHSRPAVSLPFGSNLHFNLFGLLCMFCTFAPPPPPKHGVPKQEIHSLIFNECSLVGESLGFKGKKEKKRIFLMKYSAGELQCWENNQQLSRGAGSTGIGRRASTGRRGRAR